MNTPPASASRDFTLFSPHHYSLYVACFFMPVYAVSLFYRRFFVIFFFFFFFFCWFRRAYAIMLPSRMLRQFAAPRDDIFR